MSLPISSITTHASICYDEILRHFLSNAWTFPWPTSSHLTFPIFYTNGHPAYRHHLIHKGRKVSSQKSSSIFDSRMTNINQLIQCTHTDTYMFNGPFSRTTRVSRYQKGKTNLDFTEARDSEWQWHQLGHMQVCTSLQTDNHARTPPLNFLQAGCPSCRPSNSVKALKANTLIQCTSLKIHG